MARVISSILELHYSTGNISDVTVELTTPHRTKIYWGASGRDNAEYALSFPLPADLYASPPTPNDSSVVIESEPARRYLVKYVICSAYYSTECSIAIFALNYFFHQ